MGGVGLGGVAPEEGLADAMEEEALGREGIQLPEEGERGGDNVPLQMSIHKTSMSLLTMFCYN